jgi:spore coat polysaccharide biosynthesis protein SpsF (cytidylyltransferase family)
LLGNYSDLAREHVTWDIRNAEGIRKVALPKDYMGLDHVRSLTLDTIEDLVQMKRLEATEPSLKHLRCLDSIRRISQ